MTLTEFDSIANQLLEQVQAQQQAQQAEQEIEENLPEELTNPPDSYLVDQFNSGKATAMGEEYQGETAGEDTG